MNASSNSNTTLIILLVVAAAIIAFALIWLLDSYKKKVEQTSKRIKGLKKLNEKYTFSSIQKQTEYSVALNSKAQFDKFNPSAYVMDLMDSSDAFDVIHEKAEYNRNEYDRYISEIKMLPGFMKDSDIRNTGVPVYQYKKFEKELFEKSVKKPELSPSWKIHKSYTSPAGRNSYSGSTDFSYDLLCEIYQKKNKINRAKLDVGFQRSLMTDSLRYDILRRDGFRCVICGASASDGVKLHVDHIMPVSRGGKTIPSNLRTLCERCNLGKRDKYNPSGVN